jgi:hypothetical protein
MMLKWAAPVEGTWKKKWRRAGFIFEKMNPRKSLAWRLLPSAP